MNYFILLPPIIIFITVALSVTILISNRKNVQNRILFSVILLSALWIGSSFLADHSITLSATLFWTRVAIVPPAFVLPFFLYFSLIFPTQNRRYNWKMVALIFMPAVVYMLLTATTLNVTGVSMQPWGAAYTPGLLYTLFIPYFIIYFGITLYDLGRSYSLGNRVAKAQIFFVELGLLSAFIIGIVTNIVLPFFGHSEVSVLGPSFAILLLASFNTYAILKHHLFNIKVIAAELLTFAIWLFLLVQFLVSDTPHERISNGILLVLVIFFGILLIKSVINEVQLNVKLKEADKLKSEFLGLASHQMRSPLTAIKGTASMLLEGSYGQIDNSEQWKQIDNIFKMSDSLVRVIEDLLDVSKIEQGGMKYEMQDVDMKALCQELVDEMSIPAKDKGLVLSLELKDEGKYISSADPVKIRQVILNLIDNSIKYTKQGSIKVILSHSDEAKLRIAIDDTGMGISKENIPKLFEKFSRADGGKVNAGGSGLGLYLAKEIVTAHKGKIWAESSGLGQGTVFIVELPSQKMLTLKNSLGNYPPNL